MAAADNNVAHVELRARLLGLDQRNAFVNRPEPVGDPGLLLTGGGFAAAHS
ncbi:MAG: hypothetical protein ACLQJR_08540 [Stellaceae bacterium]